MSQADPRGLRAARRREPRRGHRDRRHLLGTSPTGGAARGQPPPPPLVPCPDACPGRSQQPSQGHELDQSGLCPVHVRLACPRRHIHKRARHLACDWFCAVSAWPWGHEHPSVSCNYGSRASGGGRGSGPELESGLPVNTSAWGSLWLPSAAGMRVHSSRWPLSSLEAKLCPVPRPSIRSRIPSCLSPPTSAGGISPALSSLVCPLAHGLESVVSCLGPVCRSLTVSPAGLEVPHRVQKSRAPLPPGAVSAPDVCGRQEGRLP